MRKLKQSVRNSSNQWWEPIEEAFAGISLKGLKIVCPQCKEIGLATTRWIKGSRSNPIYTMHIKRKRMRKVCKLEEEQSNGIRGKISVLKSDIKRLLESRKPFMLFSGGKDSLATLVYLKHIAKKVGSDLTVIHVDTTAGLPENMKYVKDVCKHLEINLEVVRPTVDYFTLAKKWGIPSFGYRWCCRELKIKPIERFLAGIKEPKAVFDGIRAAESGIRKQYIPIWYHPSFKCLSVSPIFHWSDHKVISFIKSGGIPRSFLHTLGTSAECWCGAYKTERDFRELYQLNRNMFYKLAEIETQNGNRYTFIYKRGQRIPLRDLERQILKAQNGNGRDE